MNTNRFISSLFPDVELKNRLKSMKDLKSTPNRFCSVLNKWFYEIYQDIYNTVWVFLLLNILK